MPYQMYFAIWRAAMGDVPFGYWSYGSTGVGKSELAGLVQQHWGAVLSPSRFLANWMSTENFINEIAFRAKDMILVVDDFKPGGSRGHELRLMQMADRLFRSQGNTAGRGRMKRDLTLAVGHPVRAMLLSTAEELPEGESLLARMIAEEVRADPRRFDNLDLHQRNGVTGQYVKAMSSFLQWFASNYDTLKTFLTKQVLEQRKQFMGKHRRTQEAGAHLMVAATIFLQFAEDKGAVTPTERGRYLDNLARMIRVSADQQSTIQRYENPVRQARELLLLGLTQGTVAIEGHPDFTNALAETVGWYDEDGFLILMSTGFRGAVRRIARENGVNFNISSHRLGQSLDEAGWLVKQDSQGWTQVARYGEKTYRVYKVNSKFIDSIEEEPVDFEIEKPEEQF
jgi:hypothetical protein